MSNQRVLELPRRNADSVLQTLARMDAKIAEQQARIDALNGAVATLDARVQSAEQGVATLRVAKMGSGATVR